ncbi:uncharacterized protein LOC124358713 [Homalodisca vitripennis]|uniref:uncharacterized protein LOC124358713 n=1 Tax=Homalodisca vitripennis TaxID=197043 RepID=UPI001EEA1B88|nr:uncharacterized protein LOC124358713 [Homalodisca vitripennis]
MASSEQCIVASLGTKRKAASPLPTSKRLRTTENGIYYNKGETEMEVPANLLKDEVSQDDLMLILDEEDDDVFSTDAFMEVLCNIKNYPDEYDMDMEEDRVFSHEECMDVVCNIEKDPNNLGDVYVENCKDEEEDGVFNIKEFIEVICDIKNYPDTMGGECEEEERECTCNRSSKSYLACNVCCLNSTSTSWRRISTPACCTFYNITKSISRSREEKKKLEFEWFAPEAPYLTLLVTLVLFIQPSPTSKEPVPHSVECMHLKHTIYQKCIYV